MGVPVSKPEPPESGSALPFRWEPLSEEELRRLGERDDAYFRTVVDYPFEVRYRFDCGPLYCWDWRDYWAPPNVS